MIDYNRWPYLKMKKLRLNEAECAYLRLVAHDCGRTFDEIVWIEKIKGRRGCNLIIHFYDSKTNKLSFCEKPLCEGDILHKRIFLRREMRCDIDYLIKGD